MEQYLALLEERPAEFDLSLFEKSDARDFVEKYYEQYGELPAKELFREQFKVEQEHAYAPWSYYEQRLQEEKFIREAIPALTAFNNEYEGDQKQALIHLRERLTSLAEPAAKAAPVSIIHDTSRYERFKNTDNTRILTGIKPFDEASGGLSKRDEFMVISARLGIGKSWVAHAMAANMCQAGYRVGLYSGEMSEDEVGARLDSLMSHISNYALTRGKDVDLTEHLNKLSQVEGDLLVLTAAHLKRNARPSDLHRFVKEYRLDCLFIDQLDLMEPDGRVGREEFEQKAALSYQLKSLQQQLGIPIVAVSQLNRQAAQQEADASHIAGSDRIGRDATVIIALSRKEDTLKMKVLKARSWRLPDQPWEFTWDIDKGILEPKLSAMDAVMAKVKQAKAKQAVAEVEHHQEASTEDGEIW